MPLAGDDDHEQDAGDREVPEAVEERARAQERLAPEEPEALDDLRAEAGGVDRGSWNGVRIARSDTIENA